jgi:hypothetical protein
MESEHCDRAPKVPGEPRPVKTHSANRRGSARRSIHTLRPCGTHKHQASEKIVNRCCRRPLLAEAPLAVYGFAIEALNLFVQLNESLLNDIYLIKAGAPSCDFIAYFRFAKSLRRAGFHSLQGFVRGLERNLSPMLERGSRAAHYGTGCWIPIRSHSRYNRWGGLGPVETRAEDGTSDKTASISR